MRRLSFIIVFALGFLPLLAQSPHEKELKIDCAKCHDPSSWNVNTESLSFSHESTDYPLEGRHVQTSCRDCHTELTFKGTSNQCSDCHTDIHSMSVGNDCARCHSSESWLVFNIPEIHEENGFPLIGVHSVLHCEECHKSETNLRFDRIGNECINCHLEDYQTAQVPNHISSGFSQNCEECHDLFGMGWDSESIIHDFFPLTLGHEIQNCGDCHTSGSFADAVPECMSCHSANYNETINPNHPALALSNDCASCHTTDPDWVPARFDNHNDYYQLNGAHASISNNCADCHNGDYINTPNTCIACHQTDYDNTNDPAHASAQFSTECLDCHNENAWEPSTFDHDGQYFPIYSGEHNGEWDVCLDCHTVPDNFSLFSCTNCHTNPETDEEHNGISGYQYESNACFSCHPTGSAEEGIDHNFFPLTLGHEIQDCNECHITGNFSDAVPECASCHQNNYNETNNPNHIALALSNDCASCHTTDPEWIPARFDNHNDFYALNGAHATISNNCSECHNGDYNNTPVNCFGCHQTDYNNTNDPAHASAQFPTSCEDCHTENAWDPSTFDHDAQYFPIYSGKHREEWNQCIDCHANISNYSDFTCKTCHAQSETNNNHSEVSGYLYESFKCLECHPDGSNNN